jgi:acetyl-CoA synthetase
MEKTQTLDFENRIQLIAERIQDLRESSGYNLEEVSTGIGIPIEEYAKYENGELDFPLSVIHNLAHFYKVEMSEILEGSSARLSNYIVTRKGNGMQVSFEHGIQALDLASKFKNRIAEPYACVYKYEESLQNKPIELITHKGQEMDIVIKGQLKVQVGNHIEVLNEGDSIYFDSTQPHGELAVGGQDCEFYAIVLHSEDAQLPEVTPKITASGDNESLIYKRYIDVEEDENGQLKNIRFKDPEHFNFAYDVIDELAKEKPDKLAMIHVNKDKVATRYTFAEISRHSSRAANYFTSLGIKKGDHIMLVLKRHFEFWVAYLALNKIGAVAITATHQLTTKDFDYRFKAADIDGIVCTVDDGSAERAEAACKDNPNVRFKMTAHGKLDGWHDFSTEYLMFRGTFNKPEDYSCGYEPAIMYFTSGTTGYPKPAIHMHTIALGHFVTARYWQRVTSGGLHLTIADTGWAKAIWGKIFGQWLCESAIFVYDFDRFHAEDILPMVKQYNITTFCAPPTMYRYFIKDDLSKYDLSSIKHAATAGEALNLEVFKQFEKATGLRIREGFGQTETVMAIGNLAGMTPRVGAMGKPNPMFDISLLDSEGNPVKAGETGEICIRTENLNRVGLYHGYYRMPEETARTFHDGFYHTGDTAWMDEDGYYWYVGRVDDLIKSSGYRIGPFEVESVIMELPYVLECGVSAAPDEVRGQVVKASIVLTKGTEPTEELKKEIQDYVKKRTAPYKYPRIVVFRDELPKTISGKIQHSLL